MIGRIPLRERVALTSGVVVCVALVVFYALVLRLMYGRAQTDFGLFFYGLKAQLSGGSFYGISEASHWGAPFADNLLDLAPPHLHALVWPLMPLGLTTAYTLWVALNVLAFVASIWLITRELSIAWRDVTLVWFLNGVLFARLATGSALVYGQYVWLLMLPCTLAWIDLRRGRWIRSFCWLGLVLSAKPYPAVMALYAIWHGERRAPVAMFVVAGCCALLGSVLFGIDSYLRWISALSYGGEQQMWMFGNISLFGVAARMWDTSPAFVPLGVYPLVSRFIAAVAAAAVAGASLRQLKYRNADQAWLLLWLASFLVAPLAWTYYAWWLLPALMAVGAETAMASSPLALRSRLRLGRAAALSGGVGPHATRGRGDWRTELLYRLGAVVQYPAAVHASD